MTAPREEGPDRKARKPKSGLPAVIMFLGVLFGLVLLLESFSQHIGSRRELDYDQFLLRLYAGSIDSVFRHGDIKLTGEMSELPDRDGTGAGGFQVELSPGQMTSLAPDLQEFVHRPPGRIDEQSLFEQLEKKELTPVRAWALTVALPAAGGAATAAPAAPAVASDREDWLFVDYYGNQPGSLVRSKVTSRGGGCDLGRAQELLARSEVKIERKGVPGTPVTALADSDRAKIFQYEPESTFLMSLIINLVPWLLIIGVFWFFIFRQMRSPGGAGGVLSFGRARATLVGKDRTGVTFDDVAGIEEAKEEVKEIVEFLKDPARFSRIGARIPRGVLLVGQPGTGKTLLAKAIAGEANVPFFSISGSDFVEMFVGVGASRVRDLFRQAREKTPCLIFLDEIDAVGRRRGSGLGGGHDEREQTLNAILVEMDGFETDEGIILVAATNRPDVLDPALLRPGRFDRQIVIDLPDVKGREAILKVHTRHVPLDSDVELSKVARATPGFSGAEIASLVNEAALRATLLNRDRVNMADFEEARDRVRFGREKNRRVLDEKERRITAYHEAGHALVGHLHPGVEPLHKVTIIPRGMSLGATMILPEKDRYQQRREQMIGMICFAFGGRLSEEIFCGDITSGAYDDIRKATEIARNMVTLFGMSDKLGPINYAEREDAIFLGGEVVRSKSYSEDTARVIDAEVKRILDGCYAQARQHIMDHKPQLERLAEALLKYETLHADEVAAIVAGATPDEARAGWERSHPPPPPPKSRPPRAEPGTEPSPRGAPRPEEGLPPAGEPAVP